MKNESENYTYEELTLDEFAKKFTDLASYDQASITDLSGEGIQICTLDERGVEVYRDVMSFVVKPAVTHHYTDGNIKVTEDHAFVEGGLEIKAQHHKDFIRVEKPIQVVDIEVDGLHTYLANGRLNHNTTSGGKALGFHASCRIRLKPIGKLKSGSGATEQIIGVQTEAQVIKNRMGPPFKKAEFDVYFDSGIDDVNSWLKLLKNYGKVSGSGAWYQIVNEDTGEIHKFQAKDWRSLIRENAELRDYCLKQIYDIYIMKYRTDGEIDPDSVTLDENIED